MSSSAKKRRKLSCRLSNCKNKNNAESANKRGPKIKNRKKRREDGGREGECRLDDFDMICIKKSSLSGDRTRPARVKTWYPNHID